MLGLSKDYIVYLKETVTLQTANFESSLSYGNCAVKLKFGAIAVQCS